MGGRAGGGEHTVCEPCILVCRGGDLCPSSVPQTPLLWLLNPWDLAGGSWPPRVAAKVTLLGFVDGFVCLWGRLGGHLTGPKVFQHTINTLDVVPVINSVIEFAFTQHFSAAVFVAPYAVCAERARYDE